MSTSTSVYGIRLPDETRKKMKAVWEACKAAGVEIPEEVDEFFDSEKPDRLGVAIDLESNHANHTCLTKYTDDTNEVFEVDVREVPVGVTVIRFVISY